MVWERDPPEEETTRRVIRRGSKAGLPILGLLLAVLALGAIWPTVMGPADPTTVFISGFVRPCRMAFDDGGNLIVNDGGVLYRVTPAAVRSVFTDQVPDARDFAFDAFGDLLVASPRDTAIYRVSPDGQVSLFTKMFNPSAFAVGPDGSVWASAVDSIHHFDAKGRLLEMFDVATSGAAAFGIRMSPGGEPYFSSFFGMWKLASGAVVPVAVNVTPNNWGFDFDVDGNIYWAREDLDGAEDRVIQYNSSGQVIQDPLIDEVEDPCRVRFVRDQQGATTNRIMVAQQNGIIVEANAAGLPTTGWPEVGLSLRDIGETAAADEAARVGGSLSENVSRFIDVIGNNNGTYDVGDFRAFLLATGAILE